MFSTNDENIEDILSDYLSGIRIYEKGLKCKELTIEKIDINKIKKCKTNYPQTLDTIPPMWYKYLKTVWIETDNDKDVGNILPNEEFLLEKFDRNYFKNLKELRYTISKKITEIVIDRNKDIKEQLKNIDKFTSILTLIIDADKLPEIEIPENIDTLVLLNEDVKVDEKTIDNDIFKNIKNLAIYNNFGKDFLKKFKNLEKLRLDYEEEPENPQLSDIPDTVKMLGLSFLDIDNLKNIIEETKIEDIDISYIENLNLIDNIPTNIKTLKLKYVKIDNVNILKEYKNLKYLSLNNITIEDKKNVDKKIYIPENIKYLKIGDNILKNIEFSPENKIKTLEFDYSITDDDLRYLKRNILGMDNLKYIKILDLDKAVLKNDMILCLSEQNIDTNEKIYKNFVKINPTNTFVYKEKQTQKYISDIVSYFNKLKYDIKKIQKVSPSRLTLKDIKDIDDKIYTLTSSLVTILDKYIKEKINIDKEIEDIKEICLFLNKKRLSVNVYSPEEYKKRNETFELIKKSLRKKLDKLGLKDIKFE